jgi:hypothetical protein
MLVAQDIWEKYGFRGDPFDTGPLSFHEDSLLPIAEAFVGRAMDSPESQLLTNCQSRQIGKNRPESSRLLWHLRSVWIKI